MYQFISRFLLTALVLSLAACGGGGSTSTTTTPTNSLPVISEGTSTSVSMSVNSTPNIFSLTLHATDADGDTLTWSVGSPAAHGTASVSAPATGTSMAVGYTPNNDYVGADSFDVQVSDGKGGTATIIVNVNVADASPVIQQGASTTVVMSENSSPTAFKLTLDASDTNGDTLSWSISSAATHGTASVSGTGNSKAVNYTPNSGYVGSDSFVVQVSDGHGGTATITVNVSVTDVAPVITQGTSTAVNMSVNSTPTAFSLTLDATDANGDALAWSISSMAAHGSASVPSTVSNSVSVSYTPTANYVGTDSFDVQVSDGHTGGTATITVSVTVTNDNPVISQGTSISVSMSENQNPIAFSVTLDATDANGDPLTWSLATAATYGTASVSGTGASPIVSYTPNTDYIGTDSFDAQVADNHGGTATITVNLSITTTNTVSISVDTSVSGYQIYNRPFVSVTICDQSTPTPNCQTIDHIVLDTSAVGLRVLSSALSPTMQTGLTTYQDTFSSSTPTYKDVGECYQLASGYMWGTLRTATVQLGGETTGPIPIEIVGDTTAGQVPSGCSSVGTDLGSLAALQANGILGLQYFKADCPTQCTTASNNVYYICMTPSDSTTCSSIAVPVADQVSNPAFLFGDNGSGLSDNNGLTVSFPAIALAGAQTATGTLTFGINTQPNNQLGSATIMTVTSKGFLPTLFNGTTLCDSVIDSGSNNYSVPQGTTAAGNDFDTPPLCTTAGNTDFYCPTAGTYPSFPATIQGMNGTSVSTNFYIANTDGLDGTLSAFNDVANDLAPTFSTKDSNCSGTTGSFIWGMPFFFGRDVTTGFENQTVDTSNPGPFVTFKAN